jgi:hypothetical protein
MIHGVCWGAGQSTLSRRLAAVIPDVDVLWEDELSQPAIFTRDEFSDVADRFHRHNANPAAGIGNPPALMLEDAYRRLMQTILCHGHTALMGWSIMDLAEDLDWARADERALHRHSRAVREILAPLDPILVCIDGDIAAASRGRSSSADGAGSPANSMTKPTGTPSAKSFLTRRRSPPTASTAHSRQAAGIPHSTSTAPHLTQTTCSTPSFNTSDSTACQSQQKKTHSDRLGDGSAYETGNSGLRPWSVIARASELDESAQPLKRPSANEEGV